jgi:hypothetical protein
MVSNTGMTKTEYGNFLKNTVGKRSTSMSPGKMVENYIYLYHVPGDNRESGLG